MATPAQSNAKTPTAKKADNKASAAKKADIKTPAGDESEGPFIMVSATSERGRRRAGMRFTQEGVKVDVSKLSDKQKAAIDADPQLKVSNVKD